MTTSAIEFLHFFISEKKIMQNIIGMKMLFYKRETKSPYKYIIISTESFDLYTLYCY